LLSFYPVFEYDASHVAKDFVFVADCSASMRGDALQDLKRTLHLCINQLETMWRSGSEARNLRFNLLSYGSVFQYLFPRSRAVDASTLQAARQCINAMTASHLCVWRRARSESPHARVAGAHRRRCLRVHRGRKARHEPHRAPTQAHATTGPE